MDYPHPLLGIRLDVREGQCLVRCLKLSFGIHELQELESERKAIFHTVYSNDGYKPTLKAFGRGWPYIY